MAALLLMKPRSAVGFLASKGILLPLIQSIDPRAPSSFTKCDLFYEREKQSKSHYIQPILRHTADTQNSGYPRIKKCRMNC